MDAIIIKADTKTNKILYKLAKDLGGKAISLNEEQYEDFTLGFMIDKLKTNKTVTKAEVIKKLKN